MGGMRGPGFLGEAASLEDFVYKYKGFVSGVSRSFPSGKMNTRIEDPESLGAVIRARRRELGLTQTEIAEVARTTLRFISELERGKKTAQLDGVLRVLAALGIDLEARPR